MNLAARVDGVEGAELLAISGDDLRVMNASAKAIGQPVELRWAFEHREVFVSCKTHRCVRQADGRFELRVRAVNLRKVDRVALAELLGA